MPFLKRNDSSSSAGSANIWLSEYYHPSSTKRDRASPRGAGIAQPDDLLTTPKGSRAKAAAGSSSSSSLSLQSAFSTADDNVYRTSNSSLEGADDPFVDTRAAKAKQAAAADKQRPQRVSIYANYPPASPLRSEHYDSMTGAKHRSGSGSGSGSGSSARHWGGAESAKSSRGSKPPFASPLASPALSSRTVTATAKPKRGNGDAGGDKAAGRGSRILGSLDFTYRNYYGLIDAAPSATGKGGGGRARSSLAAGAAAGRKQSAAKLACW